MRITLRAIKHRHSAEFKRTLEVQLEPTIVYRDVTQQEIIQVQQDHTSVLVAMALLLKDFHQLHQRWPNQKEAVEVVLGKALVQGGSKKVVEYLNRGEGKYWSVEIGSRNEHRYVVIETTQDEAKVAQVPLSPTSPIPDSLTVSVNTSKEPVPEITLNAQGVI